MSALVARAARLARASSVAASTTGRSTAPSPSLVARVVPRDFAISRRAHSDGAPPRDAHPAFPIAPSWSTSELLHPPDGEVERAHIDVDALRAVAKRANLNLDPDDEQDALRGVNEVLRFVQALDRVDVEGVEPMWTPLPDTHACPMREDEVAETPGWAAASREDLMAQAPDRSRAPHYAAAKTAGTDDA